jgi:hypothetical protein
MIFRLGAMIVLLEGVSLSVVLMCRV